MQSGLVVNRAYLNAIGAHMEKWKNCFACPLHQGCRQRVFFRGVVPCDVLIIGTGPSADDEAVGRPMMGDFREIIDDIIDSTMGKFNPKALRTCIVHATICRGQDAPDKDAIRACSPRLAEFMKLVKPRLLICAGDAAESAIMAMLAHLPEYPRNVKIRSPGFITRLSGEDREVEMSRQKLIVNKALNNVFGNKELPNKDDDEE